MRLISVDTFRLEDFTEPDLPEYGILSHTWEGEEAKYDDVIGASLAEIQSMDKYHKIRGCARLATLDKLKYIWIDTCCINKSSSAELQEAINSMYRWYSKATICYVYLSDLSPGNFQLSGCKWVARGWTLQELIAPSSVQFHASDWSVVGNKRDNINACARATGIDSQILLTGDHSKANVAQKMSWASDRKCTRVEDIAYSLMGLFDIHMPMLYGEGEKAFIRLQEEIIRSTFDMSIFAWSDPCADNTSYSGLFASSPAYFRFRGNITSETSFENGQPYAMTNLGVHMQGLLQPLYSKPGEYKMRLMNVRVSERRHWHEPVLYLKRVSPLSNQFVRINLRELVTRKRLSNLSMMKLDEIYVRQYPIISKSHLTAKPDRIKFYLSTGSHYSDVIKIVEFSILRVWPHSDWLENDRILLIRPSKPVTLAAIWYSSNRDREDENMRVVLLSFQRPSGQRHISICDNIPIGIGEADLERAVWKSLIPSSEEAESDRDDLLCHTASTAYAYVSANFDAHLCDGKITLQANIVEMRGSEIPL